MGFRGQASSDGHVILTKEAAAALQGQTGWKSADGHESVLSPDEQDRIRATVDSGRAKKKAEAPPKKGRLFKK